MKKGKKALLLSALTSYIILLNTPKIIETLEARNIPEKEIVIETPTPTPTLIPISTPTPTVDPMDLFTEVNEYAYTKYDTYGYDTYKNEKKSYINIEAYQKVYILGTNGYYYNVALENNETSYILVSDLEILPNNYIETDLSNYTVNYYDDNDLLYSFKVDIGTEENPTDIGYYEVYAIDGKRYLCGATYMQPVNGFIAYNGGEGFHDIINSDESIYYTKGANLSHGCTRMNSEDFYILNENTEIGTKVLVHK